MVSTLMLILDWSCSLNPRLMCSTRHLCLYKQVSQFESYQLQHGFCLSSRHRVAELEQINSVLHARVQGLEGSQAGLAELAIARLDQSI